MTWTGSDPWVGSDPWAAHSALTADQLFSAVTAAGWTATGGTATAVLADDDDATLLTSPAQPSASIVDMTVRAIEKPAGDFAVALRANTSSAASASIAPTLRASDGTLLASAATLSPAAAVADFTVTFAATDIAAVTEAQWRSGALLVRLSVTAT